MQMMRNLKRFETNFLKKSISILRKICLKISNLTRQFFELNEFISSWSAWTKLKYSIYFFKEIWFQKIEDVYRFTISHVLSFFTKFPEIENNPSLVTELGLIVFKAWDNNSKFFVLWFEISRAKDSFLRVRVEEVIFSGSFKYWLITTYTAFFDKTLSRSWKSLLSRF